MIILGLEKCGPSFLLKIILFVRNLLDIAKFLIPMGLIVIISIDFAKSVISSKEDEMKKNFNLAIKRLLFAVFLFLVPTVIDATMGILDKNDVKLAVCYENVSSEAIADIEDMEKAAMEEEDYSVPTPNFNKNSAYNISPAASKGSGCDGAVYYENGVFYKPQNTEYNGKEKAKGSADYGYNKYFYEQLQKMVEAAKQQGYTIIPSTGDGAWRSYERQQYYKDLQARGGNLAATPGTSNHGWGIASDLSYGSSTATTWAHEHAKDYGLTFPISSENWHIEPINLVADDEKVKKCL